MINHELFDKIKFIKRCIKSCMTLSQLECYEKMIEMHCNDVKIIIKSFKRKKQEIIEFETKYACG